MLNGTGLDELCDTGNSATEQKEKLKELFTKDFNKENIQLRKEVLNKRYSNQANAEKLIGLVFNP